ncbi:MAG: GDSL-type esterase/lipase family protein [Candidatus Paceibacterota bacterium]
MMLYLKTMEWYRNKTYIIIGVIVLVAAIWFAFRSLGTSQIKNLDSDGSTIVAFGDSLVQGVGASKGNDFVSLLSQRIGQPIINLGVSGDTTADALLRLDDVFVQDPRIVIVLLGGNDFLRRIPMDETFANLDKIVNAIQAHESAILLLGVRGGLLFDSYDTRFDKFAGSHGVGFVPNVLSGLLGDQRYMSDTIHPNNVGYVKVADKVEPVLKKMLGEL